MQIEFFGCRGSIPSPLDYNQLTDVVKHLYSLAIKNNVAPEDMDAFLKTQQEEYTFFHGGNTSSNLIQDDKNILILEAGSGLRKMGETIMQQGLNEFHILMGHFHWDHIQGFPFFTPAYIPGNKIHIYSVQPCGEEIFRKQMSSPTFPVEFDMLGADIIFHQLDEGQKTTINGFDVNTIKMHHPDECWGYRIDKNNKSICYLSDTEITNAEISVTDLYCDFIKDSEIVVADCQYSFVEYFEKQQWGHSNVTTFIDVIKRSNVKKLVMYHHDPTADFKMINKALGVAKRYQELTAKDSNFEICSAKENTVIKA